MQGLDGDGGELQPLMFCDGFQDGIVDGITYIEVYEESSQCDFLYLMGDAIAITSDVRVFIKMQHTQKGNLSRDHDDTPNEPSRFSFVVRHTFLHRAIIHLTIRLYQYFG